MKLNALLEASHNRGVVLEIQQELLDNPYLPHLDVRLSSEVEQRSYRYTTDQQELHRLVNLHNRRYDHVQSKGYKDETVVTFTLNDDGPGEWITNGKLLFEGGALMLPTEENPHGYPIPKRAIIPRLIIQQLQAELKHVIQDEDDHQGVVYNVEDERFFMVVMNEMALANMCFEFMDGGFKLICFGTDPDLFDFEENFVSYIHKREPILDDPKVGHVFKSQHELVLYVRHRLDKYGKE